TSRCCNRSSPRATPASVRLRRRESVVALVPSEGSAASVPTAASPFASPVDIQLMAVSLGVENAACTKAGRAEFQFQSCSRFARGLWPTTVDGPGPRGPLARTFLVQTPPRNPSQLAPTPTPRFPEEPQKLSVMEGQK